MCFSTKAKVVFWLCAFMYKYNLLVGVCVFCPCVNLQCIILFADVSLSTPDVSTKSIPVFYVEGTLLRIHAVITVIGTAAKAY